MAPGRLRAAGEAGSGMLPLVLAAVLLACGCGRQEARPLLVFAAASVADAVETLAGEFTASGGPSVRVSAGASRALQRQIEAGAPADLFIAAAPEPVEALVAAGRAREEDRVDLLGNSLVCVVPAGAGTVPSAPEALRSASLGRIALGDPDLTPAGHYARQALLTLGLWDELGSRLLPAADVRVALGYVETGAAGAGLVYATDAAVSPRVRVAFSFPATAYPPIVYTAIVPRTAQQPEAARRLLRFLVSSRGESVFRAAGFTPLPGGGRAAPAGARPADDPGRPPAGSRP